MSKMRVWLRCACMICFTVILSAQAYASSAALPDSYVDKKAVVFVLDASNSMNSNDRERLAKDSIAQLIYSLPSNYSVGFVAYNTDVVSKVTLQENNHRQSIMTAVDGVRYIGYTNAGAGLSNALEMLDTSEAEEKTVVMLSDGEIIMESNEATAASSNLFDSAVAAAKEDSVKIHVIGLGADMANEANTIFSAALETNGKNYHAPKAADIQKAVDSILLDQLNVKKTTAAIVDADGGLEELNITIPSRYTTKARILLTSPSPIQNLKADFNVGAARQFNGVHYTLLELEHPSTEKIHVSFQGKAGSQVKVDVITEYAASAQINTTYTDTEPESEDAAHFERIANISLMFADQENQERQILNDDPFDGLSTPITVNGTAMDASLQNGCISFQLPVAKEENISLQIDLSKLETNILLEQPLVVSLEEPPLLPPPPDYRPWIIIGVLTILGLGIVVVCWINTRRKQQPLPIPDTAPPPPASKFDYTGRLSIYVTHTCSGYDIPPLTYNLFRIPGSKVLSLQEILDGCNVEERFEGADQIFFKPGANRCLILTNNSDCTLMQNREILMKNRSYQISLNSKVDITFEDEVSELALQYKSVKPQ